MIHKKNDRIEVHAFQTAKESNRFCGDSFFLTVQKDYFICVLADGLGSGQYANEASEAVASVVEENHTKDVDTLMDACNHALVNKRGAAVAILKVNYLQKEFEYSCVGNIRFYLYTQAGKLTYPMPVTGYLSGRPQKFRTQKFMYEPNSKFLIHTDGFRKTNIREFLTNDHSIPTMVDRLKAEQVNKEDDMSFIIGILL